MKRFLLYAILAVVAMYGYHEYFGRSQAWKVRHAGSEVSKLVAFGDSLTAAKYLREEQRFSGLLAQATGLEAVNLGVNGDTSASALKRLPQLLQHNPQLVTITLGGNDLLRKLPLGSTLDNLREIFVSLQNRGVIVVYIAIEPPLVGDNWSMAIQHLCQELGVGYVPKAMAGLWGDASKMRDRIHPNAAGHKIMAERILKVLEPLL